MESQQLQGISTKLLALFGVIIIMPFIVDFFAEAGKARNSQTNVNLQTLGAGVTDKLRQFFQDHPSLFNIEYKESGVNPVREPLQYMRIELKEPEHNNIREAVNKTGIMDLSLFEAWTKQAVKRAT